MENKEKIENYLNEQNPYCREERQWAAILYMMLVERNNRVLELIFGNEAMKINLIDVFYEATIMRDYFYKDKSFNRSLESAFGLREGSLKNINYGHSKITNDPDDKKDKLTNNKKLLIKYMMNAKPDIAIVYELDGEKYLLFMECKNESVESKYKDIYGYNRIPQTFIQELILRFLCGKHANRIIEKVEEGVCFKSRMIKERIDKFKYYNDLEELTNDLGNEMSYFSSIKNGGVKLLSFDKDDGKNIYIKKSMLYNYYQMKSGKISELIEREKYNGDK